MKVSSFTQVFSPVLRENNLVDSDEKHLNPTILTYIFWHKSKKGKTDIFNLDFYLRFSFSCFHLNLATNVGLKHVEKIYMCVCIYIYHISVI